jgi:hypothetical protein
MPLKSSMKTSPPSRLAVDLSIVSTVPALETKAAEGEPDTLDRIIAVILLARTDAEIEQRSQHTCDEEVSQPQF